MEGEKTMSSKKPDWLRTVSRSVQNGYILSKI
jgi:hypothetical protein